jgi:hypothetical protein
MFEVEFYSASEIWVALSQLNKSGGLEITKTFPKIDTDARITII